jgi:hypothetical protein
LESEPTTVSHPSGARARPDGPSTPALAGSTTRSKTQLPATRSYSTTRSLSVSAINMSVGVLSSTPPGDTRPVITVVSLPPASGTRTTLPFSESVTKSWEPSTTSAEKFADASVVTVETFPELIVSALTASVVALRPFSAARK